MEEEPVRKILTRRNFLHLVPSTLAGLGLIACAPDLDKIKLNRDKAVGEQEEILKLRGISGDRLLVDLKSIPGFTIKGSNTGSFLSFYGDISGDSSTMVQFAWIAGESDKSQILISDVPISKAAFKTVTDDFPANVNFAIDPGALVSYSRGEGIYYPRHFFNLSEFIKGDRLILATFTLSQKDFGDFRASK